MVPGNFLVTVFIQGEESRSAQGFVALGLALGFRVSDVWRIGVTLQNAQAEGRSLAMSFLDALFAGGLN